MRTSVVAALVLGVVVLGCESRVSLGTQCSTGADCPVELTCSVGRCRSTCTSATQCGEGRRCLRGASGVSVCSTAPDDSCVRVEDCVDPAFSRCVNGSCQTACSEDAECAGGDCVLGGCVERALVDQSEVGRVALGAPGATDVSVGSFVIADPDGGGEPLTLEHDDGFADVGVIVEDASSMGQWAIHVATMQRTATERGKPTILDVDVDGVMPLRTAIATFDGSDATTVAAEPMPDGRPAYLWLLETPDAETSDDRPGQMAFFMRGTDGTQPMNNGGNFAQRMPGRAFIARGFGMAFDGPAYGIRVVDGARSEIQITGPGAGGDLAFRMPIEGDSGRLETAGTSRAIALRTRGGEVTFLRLAGTEDLMGASFAMGTSTCAPGITDRDVIAEGTYALATCEGARVTVRRIVCPTGDSRALLECIVSTQLTIDEAEAPSAVELETLPGGVAIVSRDGAGVHVRLVSDQATSSATTVRYEAVLPVSYRVNALTDYALEHVAANGASRGGASVVMLAGHYVDDSGIAQVRVGVLEMAAP